MTRQAFGEKLHTYTIVDAINDGNVLPFRIDYINTVKQKDGKQDKQVSAIDTEEALASHERISEIVKYILEHFDQKTMRNAYYSLKGQRVNGFNSMLAVSSIPVCKKYYLELKRQIAEQHRDLTIATKRITARVTYALFERTLEIADRNVGLPEGSEKYRQMCKDSRSALRALIEHLDKERR